nr:RNA methyltransferase [Oscillospiraceae bacterium]
VTGERSVSSALILETVQDPGNVGTVIRTADAMGTDAVILVGGCADLYNPKTVRATMGCIFRQTVIEMDLDELESYVNRNELRLFGAALSENAKDIRKIDMNKLAVAIGSEGKGLSGNLLKLCSGQVIIPMRPNCESLNAAVAASIVMWEMSR